MTKILVSAEGLEKRFGATRALDGVTMALSGGELVGLVGGNGAGKSTLIRILGGVHRPDRGQVTVAGEPVSLRGPRDAIAAGIGVIPQELRLVPALSVADNLMLGHWPTARGVIDRRRLEEAAAALLEPLGLKTDLRCPVAGLSFAERQLVAIGRALGRDARVLILDEPTAALEAREVGRLFGILAGLKARGVGLLYVSHRLPEILELADRCIVMRDGRVVAEPTRDALSLEVLVAGIAGRAVETRPVAVQVVAPEPALIVEDCGLPVTVGRGQVAGLAGLLGSGTSGFLRRLFGAVRPPLGAVTWAGRRQRWRSPGAAIGAGVGLVPGERVQGLVPGASLRDNIGLACLGRLRRRQLEAVTAELIEALDIRPPDPNLAVAKLSGGNQQKVIFARWLAAKVDLLLLDEPTQGVDVAAKAQIHALIRDFGVRGGAVLMASSDPEELLELSAKLLVMRDGAVAAELPRAGLTPSAVEAALAGSA